MRRRCLRIASQLLPSGSTAGSGCFWGRLDPERCVALKLVAHSPCGSSVRCSDVVEILIFRLLKGEKAMGIYVAQRCELKGIRAIALGAPHCLPSQC